VKKPCFRLGATLGLMLLAGCVTGCTSTQVSELQTMCAGAGIAVTVDPNVAQHNSNTVNTVTNVCKAVAALPPAGLAPAAPAAAPVAPAP
jgi:hypothetical protein